MVLRCFTKEIVLGEFKFGWFWGFWAVVGVGNGGGGHKVCLREFVGLRFCEVTLWAAHLPICQKA
jgi:hypothetical protein